MARRGRSAGGRRRGAANGSGSAPQATLQQLPFQQLRNPFPPMEILSKEDLNRIHEASLTVLKELGLNFDLEEACVILKDAGADVKPNDPKVHFDPELVMDLVAKAPSVFKGHARNPAHDLIYGDNYFNVCLIASPPNASDIVGGRRTGNFQDFKDLLRLGQSLNVIHQIAGYPVEPIDIHPSIRHLEAERATYKLCDKMAYGYSLGEQRIRDSLEMARLARGVSMEQFKTEPSMFTVVNVNSPMQFDVPMLIGIKEMALHGQCTVVTPFTLAGAMAPVTVAGALVQQNAEALAGIAYAQAVNPGAPVMYGGFTSNVDMKSGSPAFGTPEYSKAVIIGGQLARLYGLPYRSSNTNASNHPDVQAAYESQMSLWACLMGHCNLMKHGAGWLEGGLCASFEKVIIDAEMLQMMAEMMQPIGLEEDDLGLDAMREVGPGGHYFGCAHTMARYETAFYSPMLSDWRNFESWQEAGSQDATHRAHAIYKQLLADYQPPPMDPAIAEELDAFVDRRIAEGGIETDF